MLKRLAIGTVLIVASSVVTFLFIQSTDEKREDDKHKIAFNAAYNIYALNLPITIDFCDERTPIEKADIAERLDQELLVNTYWQSHTLLYLKRCHKWFPIIEPILKQNDVPDDFKYLAVIESGLMDVVSPSGAAGFWQIMKATGEDYGLEIGSGIDERYHLEKATQAACDYLKEAKKKFGTWTMAAAAYNMGMRGLQKQVNRQKNGDYYSLLLNNETGRYIFRILAVKEILTKHADYGFHYRSKDLYQSVPFSTIQIDSTITDLALFAFKHGIDYKTLKLLNPWLRDVELIVKNDKKYTLKLPTLLGKKSLGISGLNTDSIMLNFAPDTLVKKIE